MAEKTFVLGIDCGGTHTDAALLELTGASARLLASAKTDTLHENLPLSIENVLRKLSGGEKILGLVERVTIGTTLEINALVQGKADRTALALSAGPGLDPVHFTLGEDVCIVPGGLDHRGVEVATLYTDELAREAAAWPEKGVAAVACVGKFSPRNPGHEEEMARVVGSRCSLPVTMGHTLSGKLNFPRRIATAYYNAAVSRIHGQFLSAVEEALDACGIAGRARLLKADGGAISFAASRREPVQSILSGPAASVMGSVAMWAEGKSGCSLLLDMGGTTTDIALVLDGSPVVERDGMEIMNRRTLVRSLASISIPVGGDSLLWVENGEICTGPEREGPAMAFGGERATLLDALNHVNGPERQAGNVEASRAGLAALAAQIGLPPEEVARAAIRMALEKIVKAAYALVERINSKPVYTLAALKAAKEARPSMACLVGGPARCIEEHLSRALGISVFIPPCPDVANAIGAALVRPTASLEIFADTATGEMWAPAIGWRVKISPRITLQEVRESGCELLAKLLAEDGIEDAKVESVEADLFATLDDRGRGAKDMRATCQAVPGLAATLI